MVRQALADGVEEEAHGNIWVHAGGDGLAASGDSQSVDACRYGGHCG